MRSAFCPIARRRRAGATAVRLLAAASCIAMLAGCNTAREVTGSVPTDYRHRHPIVIKEGARTVELFIGNRRGGLTAAQRADVIAFARAWRREATGGILIDLPSGTGNQQAATHALAEVRSLLAAGGVPPQGVDVRAYRPVDPSRLATLKLHYPKMLAQAGPCGLWPYDIGPSLQREHFENREYYNLGCASQHNLAAMVDNPADLVQPRGEVPAYTGRRTTVLDKYRKGEGTATNYPNADKGKISDVGQ
jgi:pilus assembly protein CpaD